MTIFATNFFAKLQQPRQGLPGQDCTDRTVSKGQDSEDGTGRTGQPEQDNYSRTDNYPRLDNKDVNLSFFANLRN